MNTNEQRYYEAVMAAYVNGNGRLAFKDRTSLQKERTALGIAAAVAMSIEETVKKDHQRTVEERLREDSARIAAEQERKAQALEQRQREEAKAKAEAEEKERKRQEEREAMERAEMEARRLRAEKEAQEDAELLEQQKRERRAKQEHEANVKQTKRMLKALWKIALGIVPLAAASYIAYRYYQMSHTVHAGIIYGSMLITVALYYAKEFQTKWLYGLFIVAVFGGCVYDYLHLNLSASASPGWDIFVKDQFTLKLSAAFAVVVTVLSAWQSSDDGRGMFHVIISALCSLTLVPLFMGGHWKIGVLLGTIVAVQVLGWLLNVMSDDADLDGSRGGLVRPTRGLWLLMCIPFVLSALSGYYGHWILATIFAIAAGSCITYYAAMICGALVLGIVLQIVG